MVAKRVLRCSLAAMAVTAIFWGVWYWIASSVPQITELKMFQDWQIALPFAISRWWDIAFAGIWAAIIALILSIKKGYLVGVGLGACLVACLVVGLGAGLGVGLVVGLGACLVACLVVGLVICLGVGLKYLLEEFQPLLEKSRQWFWPAA